MTCRSTAAKSSIIALATALTACGGGGDGETIPTPPPGAGTATFSLAASPIGLAAIRMRVHGSGLSGPVARGGARILMQQTTADTTFFVLSMTTGGAFLDMQLANIEKTPVPIVQEATSGKANGYQALNASAIVVQTTKR